jgi:hypothetical protein
MHVCRWQSIFVDSYFSLASAECSQLAFRAIICTNQSIIKIIKIDHLCKQKLDHLLNQTNQNLINLSIIHENTYK